jgi:hypothetical protein
MMVLGMVEDRIGKKKPFVFHIPWITILVALLIPLITYCYMTLPVGLASNKTVIWLVSPFNITQEIGGAGVYYNYALIVVTFLFVELYSRNMAKLQDRDFIMDNALILSVFSAYVASLIVWFAVGTPSMGSSIIGFNLFIFFAIDLIDSEFLVRVPADRNKPALIFSIITAACVILMIDASAILYIYISGNQFWYVHLLGGAIFVQFFLMYLWFTRYAVDRMEKEIGVDFKKAAKKAEIEIKEIDTKVGSKLSGGRIKDKKTQK